MLKHVYIPIFNRFIVTPSQLPRKIEELKMKGLTPIIDYSVESEQKDEKTYNEIIQIMQKIPNIYVAIKLSGIKNYVTGQDKNKILNNICKNAKENGNLLLIDAENEKITSLTEKISDELIFNNNNDYPLIHKTYQMYRRDALHKLEEDIEKFLKKNIRLGIKLVRGAYWNEDVNKGILFTDVTETHKAYDQAIKLVFDKLDLTNHSVIFATHNEKSIDLVKSMSEKHKFDKKHIKIAQLMGMKDNTLSFPLSKEGYDVMKYIPYGPPMETLPYLLRRLQENKYMLKHIL